MNALGIYLLISLTFVVGALIEFAVVVLVNRVVTAETKRSATEVEPQENENKYFVMGTSYNEQLRFMNRVSPKGNSNDKPCNNNLDTDKPRKYWSFIGLELEFYRQIDFAAFWIYLFLYLVFNIAYCIQYSTD